MENNIIKEDVDWLLDESLFESDYVIDTTFEVKKVNELNRLNPFYQKVVSMKPWTSSESLFLGGHSPMTSKTSLEAPAKKTGHGSIPTESEFNHLTFDKTCLHFEPLDTDHDLEWDPEYETIDVDGVNIPKITLFEPGERLGRPDRQEDVSRDLEKTALKNTKIRPKSLKKGSNDRVNQKKHKGLTAISQNDLCDEKRPKEEFIKELKKPSETRSQSTKTTSNKEKEHQFAPPKFFLRKSSSITSLKELFKRKDKESKAQPSSDKKSSQDISQDSDSVDKEINGDNEHLVRQKTVTTVISRSVPGSAPATPTSFKYNNRILQKPRLQVHVPNGVSNPPESAFSRIGHRQRQWNTPELNQAKLPVFHFISLFDDIGEEPDVPKVPISEGTKLPSATFHTISSTLNMTTSQIKHVLGSTESGGSIEKLYTLPPPLPDSLKEFQRANFPFNLKRVLGMKFSTGTRKWDRFLVISLSDSLESRSRRASRVTVENKSTVTMTQNYMKPQMALISETSGLPKSLYYEAEDLLAEEGVKTQLIPEEELIDMEKDLEMELRIKEKQSQLLKLQEGSSSLHKKNGSFYFDLRKVEEGKGGILKRAKRVI